MSAKVRLDPEDYGGRLASLEAQIESVCRSVDTIAEELKNSATKDDIKVLSDKLDGAIENKADKSDVKTLSATQLVHDRAINRLYGALALVSVGMPIILWLLGRAFDQ